MHSRRRARRSRDRPRSSDRSRTTRFRSRSVAPERGLDSIGGWGGAIRGDGRAVDERTQPVRLGNRRATGARRARRGPARLTAGRPRPPHGEHDRWAAPADRRPIGGQKEKGADAIGAAPSRQSVVQSFRNDSVRMGLRGVEPLTSRLSGVRSNQLSYRPLPEHDKLVTPTRSGQPRRSLRPQWNPGC